MNWVEIIMKSLGFIEAELHNPMLSPAMVSRHVCISNGHLCRAFNILTGLSVSEYIRNRRLSVAGDILASTDKSVLDVALDIGYESPEAFAKAYKRFHGVTPSESKNAKLKEFLPLQVNVTLTQDKPLDYLIIENGPIILNGCTRQVPADDDVATANLWRRAETDGYLDNCYSLPAFEYLVGVYQNDVYTIKAICNQSNLESLILSPHKWAIFKCVGRMPEAINHTWNRIYASWMTNENYSFAELPQLEVYKESENGYLCEIWIAVK